MQKGLCRKDLVPHKWLHANAKGDKIATYHQTNKVAATRFTGGGGLEEGKPIMHRTGRDCNSSCVGESERQTRVLVD
jgi:hypothetical protein